MSPPVGKLTSGDPCSGSVMVPGITNDPLDCSTLDAPSSSFRDMLSKVVNRALDSDVVCQV
jgi:hypothetical protein